MFRPKLMRNGLTVNPKMISVTGKTEISEIEGKC